MKLLNISMVILGCYVTSSVGFVSLLTGALGKYGNFFPPESQGKRGHVADMVGKFEGKRSRVSELIDQFEGNGEEKRGRVSDMVEKYEGKRGQVSDMVAKYEGKRGQVSDMVAKYEGKRGRVSDMVAKYEGKRGRVSDMVAKYEGKRGRVSDMVAKYEGKRGRVSDMVAKYEGKRGRVSDMVAKYEGKRGRVSDLVDQYEGNGDEKRGRVSDMVAQYEGKRGHVADMVARYQRNSDDDDYQDIGDDDYNYMYMTEDKRGQVADMVGKYEGKRFWGSVKNLVGGLAGKLSKHWSKPRPSPEEEVVNDEEQYDTEQKRGQVADMVAKYEGKRFWGSVKNLVGGLAGKLQTHLNKPRPGDKRGKVSCAPQYAAMSASTMCDYEDSPKASDMGVSSADKKAILDTHNALRSKVAADTKVEAADMQKMYWDEEIAKIAQKWVQVCVSGHDQNPQRRVPDYGIAIGQNWAMGQRSWTDAIQAWYDEVKDFTYGSKSNDLHVIGHFTQVVKNNAARVGCGFANCDGRPTYVCNYALGNAYDLGTPYEHGATCSACGKNCKDNLCDCKGKVCLNGGTLDLQSCSCKCAGIYSGDICDQKQCPSADPSHCGKEQPYGYPKSFCGKFSNVPQECPVMCGVC